MKTVSQQLCSTQNIQEQELLCIHFMAYTLSSNVFTTMDPSLPKAKQSKIFNLRGKGKVQKLEDL